MRNSRHGYFENNRILSIFASAKAIEWDMKYNELHRIILRNGWSLLPEKGKGSLRRYTKNGRIYTVPDHGSKEIDNAIAKKILKNLGINQE